MRGLQPASTPIRPNARPNSKRLGHRKAKWTKVRAPKNLRGAPGETRPALRFMERLLSFFRMHGRSGRRPRLENARRRFRRAGRSALRQARMPAATRFMESLLSLLRTHWDHEPPLTRPPATLSPTDGEREGVRGQFMERRAAGRFKRCASKFPCLKARNLL